MRELGLRGTFLLQYDALISDEYVTLMKENTDIAEVGLWLEVVEPQVRDAGGKWQGRYPWDWYNDVGFLIGYEPEFRLKLIDTAMEKFKEIFGAYPVSVGSWHIDAVSMKYLCERYGTVAACICRDQVGTDGYTMQGGYYNQAYYPSVNNMFCPANDTKTQINMPVFRMLGSDPIYAYDYQVFGNGKERCPTLEPAQLGYNPTWSNWYFDEVMCKERGLCFAYTQTGQENSFGWERMREGTEHQFCRVKELAEQGKLSLMTLGESGKWYKEQFASTPPAAYCAMSAWNKEDKKSVWYSCKNYRTNILWENGKVRVRDLYVFDSSYSEHYLTRRCDTHACEFRNLPVMDGTVYSTKEKPAGVYFTDGSSVIEFTDMKYTEQDGEARILLTAESGDVTVHLSENGIYITYTLPRLVLRAQLDIKKAYGNFDTADEQFANHNNSSTSISFITKVSLEGNALSFTFDGFDYAIEAVKGHFEDMRTLVGEGGEMQIAFPHIKESTK